MSIQDPEHGNSNRERLLGLNDTSPTGPPVIDPWQSESVPRTPNSEDSSGVSESPDYAPVWTSPDPQVAASVLAETPAGDMALSPPCTWVDARTQVPYVWLKQDMRPIRRASVAARIGLFVVDLVVAFCVTFAVTLLPAFLATATGNDDFWGPVTFVTFVVAFLAYWAICYGVWGQTLGMRLGRLQVISKTTGSTLTWGRSWLRALVLILYIPMPFGWIIWWAVTGNTQWRQGPHDFAANSIVVVKD